MSKVVILKQIRGKTYGLIGIFYAESKANRIANGQRSIGLSVPIEKGTKDDTVATRFGERRAGRRYWAVYTAGKPKLRGKSP